ncbi:Fic family protein [Enterococcus hulanensis]|uniref:Fic family protein n=1 Tax=Enterococcus hulanensis TaxID=2559929 RepID=UPI002890E861|nr:Fic family protein [Enterococcus hulanensis]MDT2660490.1 Fic family protein [Enterococcus hulanensis]
MAVKEFNYRELENLSLSHDLLNMLTKVHEYKGKQELYIATKPEILNKLTDLALIQSTEASNKIEGIATTNGRLKQIVEEKVTPRNRDEEEIAGYRDVLKLIHESYEYINVVPNDILTLHKNLYNYSAKSYKGKFKSGDNVITEKDVDGNERVRFVPAPAYLTPDLVEELCYQYNQAVQKGEIDPLLLIPCFVLDFLSIHPFSDGNGRMSRLLTLLLLYKSGYLVGKYISIELLIEESKQTYYEALQASSVGWIKNEQDYTPFVRYLLGIILRAYEGFSERFEVINNRISTPAERLLLALQKSFEPLSRAELEVILTDISRRTIERALSDLQMENKIEKIGQGRSTRYQLSAQIKS